MIHEHNHPETAKDLPVSNLEESEAKFRSLVLEAPVATALYKGSDLTIDLANDAMLKLWGKSAEVIGQPLDLALPELEGQPFLGLLQDVFRTGKSYATNEQSADLVVGGVLQRSWFNFSYKPLFNASNNVYAILNMAVDVSEQVFARRKVEEAEATLRGAVELADLGTWSADFATGEVLASARLHEWFGFVDKIDLVSVLDPILEKDRLRVQLAIEQLRDPQKGGSYDEEYTVVNRQTGEKRIIHAKGKTYFDSTGQALRVVGTARDVTLERELQLKLEQEVKQRTLELDEANRALILTNQELFESNDQLQRSNEELSQYAYVASHDLQEPLRKIRLFSTMLANKPGLPSEVTTTLNKIEQSAGRMSALVKDLLDFSQLLHTENLVKIINLDQVVRAVITDLELAIEDKNALIEVSPLPSIQGVNQQITQLFYNLIANALKFSSSERSPVIQITASIAKKELRDFYLRSAAPEQAYVHVIIRDNGIGFEPQHNEQIFEIFKRLHGTSTYSGTGIGLAMCRRIVENHSGKIWAEGSPGEGASFHLLLPVSYSKA